MKKIFKINSDKDQSQRAKSPKKHSVGVFLTIWHCILDAELTKKHSFRLFFFGDFTQWEGKKPSRHRTLIQRRS